MVCTYTYYIRYMYIRTWKTKFSMAKLKTSCLLVVSGALRGVVSGVDCAVGLVLEGDGGNKGDIAEEEGGRCEVLLPLSSCLEEPIGSWHLGKAASLDFWSPSEILNPCTLLMRVSVPVYTPYVSGALELVLF